MPPPGYEPFLRAICESPEDDAPRLVYADWLEEQGGEENVARAEFIRVQIERARLRAEGTDSDELARRAAELQHQFGERWRKDELPRISHVNWHRFWRGFVSGADVSSGIIFVRHAESIFNATPVQFLVIEGLSSETSVAFAASPLLLRLQGLTINDPHLRIGVGWQAVVNSPFLGNLRWLVIHGVGETRFGTRPYPINPVDEETARLLAHAPHFGRLELIEIRADVTPTIAAILRERYGSRARWPGIQ